jgi:predicted secreted protein
MIISYIVVLTCVWWIVFFMALPFGNQVIVKPEIGHADSAPTFPRLGLKIMITSIISVVLTIIIIYFIEHGYLAKLFNLYEGLLIK